MFQGLAANWKKNDTEGPKIAHRLKFNYWTCSMFTMICNPASPHFSKIQDPRSCSPHSTLNILPLPSAIRHPPLHHLTPPPPPPPPPIDQAAGCPSFLSFSKETQKERIREKYTREHGKEKRECSQPSMVPSSRLSSSLVSSLLHRIHQGRRRSYDNKQRFFQHPASSARRLCLPER